MDRLVRYIHGQEFLDTHINKTYRIYTWTDLLDIYMNKKFLYTDIDKTYWFDTWTDLLDTYMNNNSWTHTLTRLIGFIHGPTCWIDTWPIILGYTY